ncbi:hypothetical protein GPECTOR_1g863 [Gonium pectorale]|uniref:Cleavage/polyadenylation specificity factor A subunit N-terminal domain-containing protein n=1 Tax=Gonium pectorale TaxID=33097 RepID=A0A150H482_GONPE|nr:hypothetical protein GPECTOR_1g863 [Gonium pectorale]|eukprot:KXZ56957.1 hypothetical protein GPECTOR_1g863 [Gonium pectorale]
MYSLQVAAAASSSAAGAAGVDSLAVLLEDGRLDVMIYAEHCNRFLLSQRLQLVAPGTQPRFRPRLLAASPSGRHGLAVAAFQDSIMYLPLALPAEAAAATAAAAAAVGPANVVKGADDAIPHGSSIDGPSAGASRAPPLPAVRVLADTAVPYLHSRHHPTQRQCPVGAGTVAGPVPGMAPRDLRAAVADALAASEPCGADLSGAGARPSLSPLGTPLVLEPGCGAIWDLAFCEELQPQPQHGGMLGRGPAEGDSADDLGIVGFRIAALAHRSSSGCGEVLLLRWARQQSCLLCCLVISLGAGPGAGPGVGPGAAARSAGGSGGEDGSGRLSPLGTAHLLRAAAPAKLQGGSGARGGADGGGGGGGAGAPQRRTVGLLHARRGGGDRGEGDELAERMSRSMRWGSPATPPPERSQSMMGRDGPGGAGGRRARPLTQPLPMADFVVSEGELAPGRPGHLQVTGAVLDLLSPSGPVVSAEAEGGQAPLQVLRDGVAAPLVSRLPSPGTTPTGPGAEPDAGTPAASPELLTALRDVTDVLQLRCGEPTLAAGLVAEGVLVQVTPSGVLLSPLELLSGLAAAGAGPAPVVGAAAAAGEAGPSGSPPDLGAPESLLPGYGSGSGLCGSWESLPRSTWPSPKSSRFEERGPVETGWAVAGTAGGGGGGGGGSAEAEALPAPGVASRAAPIAMYLSGSAAPAASMSATRSGIEMSGQLALAGSVGSPAALAQVAAAAAGAALEGGTPPGPGAGAGWGHSVSGEAASTVCTDGDDDGTATVAESMQVDGRLADGAAEDAAQGHVCGTAANAANAWCNAAASGGAAAASEVMVMAGAADPAQTQSQDQGEVDVSHGAAAWWDAGPGGVALAAVAHGCVVLVRRQDRTLTLARMSTAVPAGLGPLGTETGPHAAPVPESVAFVSPAPGPAAMALAVVARGSGARGDDRRGGARAWGQAPGPTSAESGPGSGRGGEHPVCLVGLRSGGLLAIGIEEAPPHSGPEADAPASSHHSVGDAGASNAAAARHEQEAQRPAAPDADPAVALRWLCHRQLEQVPLRLAPLAPSRPWQLLAVGAAAHAVELARPGSQLVCLPLLPPGGGWTDRNGGAGVPQPEALMGVPLYLPQHAVAAARNRGRLGAAPADATATPAALPPPAELALVALGDGSYRLLSLQHLCRLGRQPPCMLRSAAPGAAAVSRRRRAPCEPGTRPIGRPRALLQLQPAAQGFDSSGAAESATGSREGHQGPEAEVQGASGSAPRGGSASEEGSGPAHAHGEGEGGGGGEAVHGRGYLALLADDPLVSWQRAVHRAPASGQSSSPAAPLEGSEWLHLLHAATGRQLASYDVVSATGGSVATCVEAWAVGPEAGIGGRAAATRHPPPAVGGGVGGGEADEDSDSGEGGGEEGPDNPGQGEGVGAPGRLARLLAAFQRVNAAAEGAVEGGEGAGVALLEVLARMEEELEADIHAAGAGAAAAGQRDGGAELRGAGAAMGRAAAAAGGAGAGAGGGRGAGAQPAPSPPEPPGVRFEVVMRLLLAKPVTAVCPYDGCTLVAAAGRRLHLYRLQDGRLHRTGWHATRNPATALAACPARRLLAATDGATGVVLYEVLHGEPDAVGGPDGPPLALRVLAADVVPRPVTSLLLLPPRPPARSGSGTALALVSAAGPEAAAAKAMDVDAEEEEPAVAAAAAATVETGTADAGDLMSGGAAGAPVVAAVASSGTFVLLSPEPQVPGCPVRNLQPVAALRLQDVAHRLRAHLPAPVARYNADEDGGSGGRDVVDGDQLAVLLELPPGQRLNCLRRVPLGALRASLAAACGGQPIAARPTEPGLGLAAAMAGPEAAQADEPIGEGSVAPPEHGGLRQCPGHGSALAPTDAGAATGSGLIWDLLAEGAEGGAGVEDLEASVLQVLQDVLAA